MVTWDKNKCERNIIRHGIDFVGAETIFDCPMLTREDDREYPDGEQRLRSIAMLEDRIVFLVWIEREAGAHIISIRNGMSKKSISARQSSKTNWKRVDSMNDEDIQFEEDSPKTTPEDWAKAIVHTGVTLPRKKTQIALRLDDEVLNWFKDQGPGYQTRINAILKAYKSTHEENRKAGM